jgi:drug/metabolite transporter (DMT)-like permease
VTATPDKRLAYLSWGAVCLIWGTTYLGIRVALETIPPALIGGIRYTIAGVVLGALVAARGIRLPPWQHWRGLALLGALMIVIGNGFVIWAEQWVPSGISAVVIGSAPFWMAGTEAMSPRGERLTVRTATGLCVGFCGILLLVWPELMVGGDGGRRFVVGVIALQLACIGWSLGSAYSKRHAMHDHPLASSALQMLFGGLMMLVLATARGEWSVVSFTAKTAAAELYLVLFGSITAYSAYVYALKHLPMSTVSLYAYVNPVIAVCLGTLLLDEPFSSRVVAAAAMVLLGIAVVRGAGTRRQMAGLRANLGIRTPLTPRQP